MHRNKGLGTTSKKITNDPNVQEDVIGNHQIMENKEAIPVSD
jgi:hypothetical protein